MELKVEKLSHLTTVTKQHAARTFQNKKARQRAAFLSEKGNFFIRFSA